MKTTLNSQCRMTPAHEKSVDNQAAMTESHVIGRFERGGMEAGNLNARLVSVAHLGDRDRNGAFARREIHARQVRRLTGFSGYASRRGRDVGGRHDRQGRHATTRIQPGPL
jgi:hypothetical protein